MRRFVILLVIFLFTSALSAAEQRIALIIGNSKYLEFGNLTNPINDAKGVNQALKDLGYSTRLVIDADELTMRREVKRFASTSQGVEVALVYYAGHGSQVNGENYLLPVDLDTPKAETDIQLSSIKVDDIINSLRSKIKVVLLDACRDNPAMSKSLVKGRGTYRGGLAPVNASMDSNSEGVFIAYATDSGSVASDGAANENSPFTAALLKNIKKPVSIDDMFSMVTKEVKQQTSNKQRPYKYASLEGVFCLPYDCNNTIKTLNEKIKLEENPTLKYSKALSSNLWVEVNNDDSSFFFYEPKSMERFEDRVRIKSLAYRYANPNAEYPLDSYAVTEWAADCKNNQYYMTQVDIMLDETAISSFTWGNWKTIDLNPQKPAAGTIVEQFLYIACQYIKPQELSTENLIRFFSTTNEIEVGSELKKVVYIYYYDKTSIKKKSNLATVNYRITSSLAVPLITNKERDYRQINWFLDSHRNKFNDYYLTINCDTVKLPTFHGFGYAEELKTPLNIFFNSNWEIQKNGYIDFLKELVCK